MEGRIETFNKDAEEIFGYSADEVVGKKRVSLFSPGLVVLGHVGTWLKTAVKEGEFRGRTAFVRKDGSQFSADIRITPTSKDGVQIGYCGYSVPTPEIDPADAMPHIGLFTRIFAWLVVTRAPFLTATIIPVLLAAAWVVARGTAQPFPWDLFGLVMGSAVALHVSANTFNDYFDWKSGTDQANADYFLPFTGGSRSIELGLVTPRKLWWIAMSAMVISGLLGVALMLKVGSGLLWFGAAGAFSAFFYTAPPLRLVARRGLGELLVGLNFGPLLVGAVAYSLTGAFEWSALAVGVPIGLLTTAILWINEFPDVPSDAATGKHHLVATLGTAAARWGYLALIIATFALLAMEVAAEIMPQGALFTLGAIPLAAYALVIIFKHYADRTLIRASAATIQLHVLAGLLMTGGILFPSIY